MKAQILCGALTLVSALALSTQEPAPMADTPLAAGDKAPTFTLNDQAGKLAGVAAESDGWTVIAFYPKALTGG